MYDDYPVGTWLDDETLVQKCSSCGRHWGMTHEDYLEGQTRCENCALEQLRTDIVETATEAELTAFGRLRQALIGGDDQ